MFVWLKHYQNADLKNERLAKEIASSFVNNIIIDRDKIKIIFNYTKGKDRVTITKDMDLISKRLEHTKISMTLDIYGHLYPNEEYKIVDLINQENK